MKVVINKCFGGFGLSKRALLRLCELQGRKCFFFKSGYPNNTYIPISVDDKSTYYEAFDIENFPEVFKAAKVEDKGDYLLSNAVYKKHEIDTRPENRSDPFLVQVVEELGSDVAGGGSGTRLEIVEIPDGVNYEIDEYDGQESIHESHRS